MKKISELKNTPLRGVRFIFPADGAKYYWWSQWQKGVWAKKDLKSEQVFPLFIDDLKEALDWEVCS